VVTESADSSRVPSDRSGVGLGVWCRPLESETSSDLGGRVVAGRRARQEDEAKRNR